MLATILSLPSVYALPFSNGLATIFGGIIEEVN